MPVLSFQNQTLIGPVQMKYLLSRIIIVVNLAFAFNTDSGLKSLVMPMPATSGAIYAVDVENSL